MLTLKAKPLTLFYTQQILQTVGKNIDIIIHKDWNIIDNPKGVNSYLYTCPAGGEKITDLVISYDSATGEILVYTNSAKTDINDRFKMTRIISTFDFILKKRNVLDQKYDNLISSLRVIQALHANSINSSNTEIQKPMSWLLLMRLTINMLLSENYYITHRLLYSTSSLSYNFHYNLWT